MYAQTNGGGSLECPNCGVFKEPVKYILFDSALYVYLRQIFGKLFEARSFSGCVLSF